MTSAFRLGLNEVLLTNALHLTGDMMLFLRDNAIRLMISLDGLGAANDRQRAPRQGGGVAGTVLKRIGQALELGLKPHLSITITALNAEEIAEVVELALDHGLPFNLNFYRAAPSQPDLRAPNAALIRTVRDVLQSVYARPSGNNPPDWSLDRLALGSPHSHPCGAGESYVVIDPRGRVAQCHMQLSRPVSDIARGEILRAVRRDDSSFRNPPVTERLACRACVWRHWCGGGCPLDVFRTTNSWDGRSPYCEVYQTVLPELLRLEGLRLLKGAQVAH